MLLFLKEDETISSPHRTEIRYVLTYGLQGHHHKVKLGIGWGDNHGFFKNKINTTYTTNLVPLNTFDCEISWCEAFWYVPGFL